MKVVEPKRTINCKKMKSLMRTLSGCGDLKYAQQPSKFDGYLEYGFNDHIDLTDARIERIRLLKDIIALADVAKSKHFTSDTSDRELLSDIFTEIFIKAKGLQNYEYLESIEDVTDEVNYNIRKFELKNKGKSDRALFDDEFESNFLSARSIKSIRANEIRLIEADVNEFVLRLGDIDYYVRLLGREFILNGIVSDSITFSEKVVKITDEK